MSRNRLILCGLLIFSCVLSAYSQSQSSTKKQDEENLYWTALHESIVEMNKQWGRFADSNGDTRARVDYHHMFVVADSRITDGLPTRVDDYQVEYLSSGAQIERFKKLRKGFYMLEIQPMRAKGAHLEIVISGYWVSYKKRMLVFAFSDWSSVEFTFDCTQQRFAVSKVELGGI